MKQRCCILALAILVLLANIPVGAQGLFYTLFHPNVIGGNLIATQQNPNQLGGIEGAGPGLDIFFRYDLSPSIYVTAATGISTITDDYFAMKNFRTTLLPSIDLGVGFNLMSGSKFTPFIHAGLTAFGWTSTVKVLNTTSTSDMFFDGGGFIGGGFRFALSEKLAAQISADYRYIASSTAVDKPELYVVKAGLAYTMKPKGEATGEEIEYPLGEGEMALDDLFKDETSDGKGEEDALSLLFDQPGESGRAGAKEESGGTVDNISSSSYANNEIEQLMNKIDDLKTEMDERGRQIIELQSKVRSNEQTIADLTRGIASGYTSESGSFGISSADDFKSNYENGLQKFYNKQYGAAVEHFRTLLGTNPDHRLASNCQYWIGESYNAMGDYQKAIDAFNSVMQYHSSYKLDDALLMSGLCYMKMGDRLTARENFQQLVSRFPDSEYAPKAMRYLGQL